MPKVTERCTGDCCRCFTIPMSPHEVEASYWAWKTGGEQFARGGSNTSPLYQDIHLLAPMVVYLGKFDRPPKAAEPINPSDDLLLNGKFDGPRHYYRCKHFDDKTKKCTIYEMRPVMCRGYPNGRPCNYVGCTWKEVRAKKETKPQRAKRLRVLQDQRDGLTDPGGEGIVEEKAKEIADKLTGKTKPKRGLGRGIEALIPKSKSRSKSKSKKGQGARR